MSAMTAKAGGFVFERGVHVNARRQERWRKAKQHAGQHGYRDRKRERADVGAEIELDRDFSLRQQRRQQPGSPISEEQSEQGAKTAEQDALDEQLPDQPQATTAQRQPDRNLFPSRDC